MSIYDEPIMRADAVVYRNNKGEQKSEQLLPTTKYLLAFLLEYAEEEADIDGYFSISQDDVCYYCGVAESSVKRAVRVLEVTGLISVFRKTGIDRKSNMYRINNFYDLKDVNLVRNGSVILGDWYSDVTLTGKEKQLYVMQNAEGLFKIGISNSVESRRNNIEKTSGIPTFILKTYNVKDASVCEKYLHEYFSATKQPVNEWFYVVDINFITEYIESKGGVCNQIN